MHRAARRRFASSVHSAHDHDDENDDGAEDDGDADDGESDEDVLVAGLPRGGAAGPVAGVDPDGDGAVGGERGGPGVLHEDLEPVRAHVPAGESPGDEHLPAVGIHVEAAAVVPGSDDELDLAVEAAVGVVGLDHSHGLGDVVVHGDVELEVGAVGVRDDRSVVVFVQDGDPNLGRVVERRLAFVHGEDAEVVVGHRLVVQRAR